jgi:hypothetical protein
MFELFKITIHGGHNAVPTAVGQDLTQPLDASDFSSLKYARYAFLVLLYITFMSIVFAAVPLYL